MKGYDGDVKKAAEIRSEVRHTTGLEPSRHVRQAMLFSEYHRRTIAWAMRTAGGMSCRV
jgi:hypothetical protein